MLFLIVLIIVIIIVISKMNAWFSAETPLLGEVFKYLAIKDVCRWRMSYKDTQMSDIYCNGTWDLRIRKEPGVHSCSSCKRIRGYKGLFPCEDCHRTVCVDHVVVCRYCSHELCTECANTRGCRKC